jgi:6-phosphogluconolactonase/glucosamine-6-phosphate isomerase/deaminase
LDGQSLAGTAAAYDGLLQNAFDDADFRLGFFGIGPDGHIAGILPGSPALKASGDQLATGYDDKEINVAPSEGVKRGISRLTMTPAAVGRLDEAVCLALGPAKKAALQELHEHTDGPFEDLPARLLISVPKVTIFTDQPV